MEAVVTEATETWLTQDAFDRLQAELDERSGPTRAEIVAKIEAARDEGDLKENGGYHAAKDDQGKNEARIRQLKQLLDRANIGIPADAGEGKATHGTIVEVRFPDGDAEKFFMGSREENAHSDINVYSPTSPLGSAVLGHEVGQTVSYDLPNGTQMSVEILSVALPG
jgi:transcription elongation factor GreA